MYGGDSPSESTPLAVNMQSSRDSSGYQALRSRSPSATVTLPSEFAPSSEDFQHGAYYSRATMLRCVRLFSTSCALLPPFHSLCLPPS